MLRVCAPCAALSYLGRRSKEPSYTQRQGGAARLKQMVTVVKRQRGDPLIGMNKVTKAHVCVRYLCDPTYQTDGEQKRQRREKHEWFGSIRQANIRQEPALTQPHRETTFLYGQSLRSCIAPLLPTFPFVFDHFWGIPHLHC